MTSEAPAVSLTKHVNEAVESVIEKLNIDTMKNTTGKKNYLINKSRMLTEQRTPDKIY